MTFYDILLAKKIEDKRDPKVKGLTVTENGTYSESGTVYNVVNVNVSLPENCYQKKTASGAMVSFTDGSNEPLSDLVIDITAAQSGSGDPSPTNVRPISGFNGGDVNVAGKNLLKLGSKTFVKYESYNFVLPPGTYTLSSLVTSSDTDSNVCLFTVLNSNSNSIANVRLARNVRTSDTFTITEPSAQIRLYSSYNNTQSTGDTATWADIQIEYGSTATSYEPYNGTTYSVSWQSQTGTVYGGNIDLVSGVLTVTHANIASYDGETLPSTWISDRDVYSVGGAPTAGAQVVYELATPLTYQLTPIMVRTLLGNNNIYADCGAIDVLSYFTKLN